MLLFVFFTFKISVIKKNKTVLITSITILLYYPVTLTKGHNFTKQSNFSKGFSKTKITGNIK